MPHLPPTKRPDVVRIAAVGDLHCTRSSKGELRDVFAEASEEADILALCGDLTDYGLPEEAEILSRELQVAAHIPIVAVLGNHDFESNAQEEVRRILGRVGVKILDGGPLEVHGVGFAGTKGFGGGFARGTLSPWGEPAIKLFVQEALDEALKLEMALGRTRASQRVVLLHYSPIHQTLVGENPEITAFLGTGRLEEPINRFAVTAVCHGHAHYGTPEGRTSTGVPVFNVAMPLLKRSYADRPPYRILELPREAERPEPPTL